MAQLARSYGMGQLSHIEELAGAEEIPQNYLVQILNELRNGGLIHSRRGKQGGYALARAPAEVTLFEIISVVDPDLLESKVASVGQSGPRVATVWEALNRSFCSEVQQYTLSEFLPKEGGDMYYI